MPPYPEDESAVGRKRSSVRFAGHLQDLSEQHCDIDEFDKEVSHVANRLSSKSMPAISLVGQRRNGGHSSNEGSFPLTAKQSTSLTSILAAPKTSFAKSLPLSAGLSLPI